MLRLRGHHLICLHFFNGEGYDEHFINNLESVLKRAGNEEITVCSGADDVCTSCLHLKNVGCRYTDNAEEEITEMDQKAISLLDLSVSGRVSWNVLSSRVNEILPLWYKLYCGECDWRKVCEKHSSFRFQA